MKPLGVLPLYKPKGMTSHDCVMKARRWFKTKQVGHTGTLDPDVTGVLPLCIGRATKVANMISGLEKKYSATVTIGTATTTEDASGEIVQEEKVDKTLNHDQVDSALVAFQGTITQVPPYYSAVKVKGKRLYEYAREGLEVERPEREVTIFTCERTSELSFADNGTASFDIDIHCSKGTYVRTVAVDIGAKLGYPAHMSALVRTAAGPFTTSDCISYDKMEELQRAEEAYTHLFTIQEALPDIAHVEVDQGTAQKIMHGAVLERFAGLESSPVLFLYKGQPLALYMEDVKRMNALKPQAMLALELPS
ncbi:tRNA pseudouridine(55) synthase TruB [Salsuginibacillus kocurii]|uniref:tRNA pseudouridine(55) synthase TruB n=1 Tax=Salsuginibacillus kocurii TaxID=427078 RepID=UPI000379B7A4|nr:tRNA pseudouridine(55) synthase TruB [Salsuginibacillus kocurii]